MLVQASLNSQHMFIHNSLIFPLVLCDGWTALLVLTEQLFSWSLLGCMHLAGKLAGAAFSWSSGSLSIVLHPRRLDCLLYIVATSFQESKPQFYPASASFKFDNVPLAKVSHKASTKTWPREAGLIRAINVTTYRSLHVKLPTFSNEDFLKWFYSKPSHRITWNYQSNALMVQFIGTLQVLICRIRTPG